MPPSPTALSRARSYLAGVGIRESMYPVRKNGRVVTTWNQVVSEVAVAMEEEGLAGPVSARHVRHEAARNRDTEEPRGAVGERKCNGCGGSLEGHAPQARTCSDACRQKVYRRGAA